MSFHASLIQPYMTLRSALRVWPLAVQVCSPEIIHSCHLTVRRSLKGLLIQTSRGWRVPVIPPGITVHSVFSDGKVLRTNVQKMNPTQASIHGDLNQQLCSKRCFANPSPVLRSSIFSLDVTTTPWRKAIFFGKVLNWKFRSISKACQHHSKHVLVMSCCENHNTFYTFLFYSHTTSNVKGVWSCVSVQSRVIFSCQ